MLDEGAETFALRAFVRCDYADAAFFAGYAQARRERMRHDPPPPYVTERLVTIVAAAADALGAETAERRRREGAAAGLHHMLQRFACLPTVSVT